MTWPNLSIFIVSLLGVAALALAMPQHSEAILRKTLSDIQHLVFRVVGWLLLSTSLALGVAELNFDMGTVVWIGWLSIASLLLAFYLPYGPWQDNKERRYKETRLNKTSNETKLRAKPQGASRLSVAALIVITPLIIFTLQLIKFT
jgi:hypothetical protein